VESFTVSLPLRLVSTLNRREHHMARARRVAAERGPAMLVTRMALPWPRPLEGSFHVELIRIGPKKLDGDNLQGACKAVRDGVAEALEIDDGSDRLTWVYGQERGAYGVRITVSRFS
jgi:hypothetical protein